MKALTAKDPAVTAAAAETAVKFTTNPAATTTTKAVTITSALDGPGYVWCMLEKGGAAPAAKKRLLSVRNLRALADAKTTTTTTKTDDTKKADTTTKTTDAKKDTTATTTTKDAAKTTTTTPTVDAYAALRAYTAAEWAKDFRAGRATASDKAKKYPADVVFNTGL